MFVNYAHRGASAYAPENTMTSFRKALQLGANGIELDLQQTKDGKIVVFHDNKIDKKSSLERLYKLDEIKRRGGLNSSVLLFVKCQFNITTVI